MDFRRIAGFVGSLALVPTALEWTKRLVDAIGFIHLPSDLLELAVKAAQLPQALSWGMFIIGLACLSFLLYDTLIKRLELSNSYVTLRKKLGTNMAPVLLVLIGATVAWIGAVLYIIQSKGLYFGESPIVFPETVKTSEPTAEVTKELQQAHYSFEERQFRIDARRFVLADLSPLFTSLQLAISQPNLVDGQPFDKNVGILASKYLVGDGPFISTWQDMFSYASKKTEEIDPKILAEKIERALYVYKYAKIVACLFSDTVLSKNDAPFKNFSKDSLYAEKSFITLRSSTSEYFQEMNPD